MSDLRLFPAQDELFSPEPTAEDRAWDRFLEGLADSGPREFVRPTWTPDISLRDYVKQAWPEVEPGRDLSWNWHIDSICEHLEAVSRGEILRLIINIPFRHMKSLLIAVMWQTWEWTFQPWTQWLYSSYGERLSKRDSLKCRRLITSDWYQSRWSHRFQLTRDQAEKLRFENNWRGYRLATSFGGMATGEGGDRVVVDDPLKAADARSDNKRNGVNETFDDTLSSRTNDPQRTAFVIIMQRLHAKDLSGHLLSTDGWHAVENPGGWQHICLPGSYEPPPDNEADRAQVPEELRSWSETSLGVADPRGTPDQPLWEERFPREVVTRIKRRLGSFNFACQWQQRPAPSEGGIFKRNWWTFWEPTNQELGPVVVRMPDGSHYPARIIKAPHKFRLKAQSWDMTFKDLQDGSLVVGQEWGLGYDDVRRYLLAQVRARADFVDTLDLFSQLDKQHDGKGPRWIEDKANGPAVMSALRGKVAGIIAVSPVGSKTERYIGQQADVEAGDVVLPHPALAPWIWDFIEELSLVPNATNDDQADAFAQANHKLRQWLTLNGAGSNGQGGRFSRHVPGGNGARDSWLDQAGTPLAGAVQGRMENGGAATPRWRRSS